MVKCKRFILYECNYFLHRRCKNFTDSNGIFKLTLTKQVNDMREIVNFKLIYKDYVKLFTSLNISTSL